MPAYVERVADWAIITLEGDMAGTTPNNAPSKTGNPSGGGRGNNPPAKGK